MKGGKGLWGGALRDHTKKGFIADYGKGGLDMEKKPDGEISTDYRATFFFKCTFL